MPEKQHPASFMVQKREKKGNEQIKPPRQIIKAKQNRQKQTNKHTERKTEKIREKRAIKEINEPTM